MNTNRNKLALRRHSIRMLTTSELQVAHGGSEQSGHLGPQLRDRRRISVGA